MFKSHLGIGTLNLLPLKGYIKIASDVKSLVSDSVSDCKPLQKKLMVTKIFSFKI